MHTEIKAQNLQLCFIEERKFSETYCFIFFKKQHVLCNTYCFNSLYYVLKYILKYLEIRMTNKND